jgi:catalase
LPYKVSGEVNRYNHREGNDDYTQAGDLFRLMSPADKQALISNIAGHMKGIPERIAKLQIEHFTKADPAYGKGVADALGIEIPKAFVTGVK